MKLSTQYSSVVILAVLDATSGFSFTKPSSSAPFMRQASTRAASSSALQAVGLYYSTSTGNTETVGGYLAEATGLELEDIGDVSDDAVAANEGFIVGAPTWHTGEDEQRSGTSWDDWLYSNLPNIDVSGKKVAIFGVGDQGSYSDNYCDAAGELYDLFSAAGAKIYGMTSVDGYDHTESKAEVDGKFVGLMCDEDNQYDLSDDRCKAWVAQLKTEGFF